MKSILTGILSLIILYSDDKRRGCEKARGAEEIAWCGCEAGLHNPFPPPPRAGPARSFPSPLRGPASLHRACVSLRPVPSDSLAATASEALHTTS